MNNETVLSVVVPSYNIEDYIEKSIKSFLNIDKKYQEMFEVIIVNDGSKDKTVQVAEQLLSSQPFNNIRILNKKNGGHGSTINRGLVEAKGKYFKVIDGDDWVDKLAFEELLDKLNQIDCDMVITNYTEQYVHEKVSKLIQPINIGKANQVQSGVPDSRIPMHSITYKTSVLRDNQIMLTEGIFYVDIQYTLFPLKHIQSWVYYPLNVYQYLLGRTGQSVNINSYVKNVQHHLTVIESVLKFWKSLDKGTRLNDVVDTTIVNLLNMQIIINYCSTDSMKLTSQTLKMLSNYGFKFSYTKASKLSSSIILLYKYPFMGVVLRKVVNQKIRNQFGFEV
ncbi:glycosyltransferase family 2 protein [Streptococcus suis]|nr:glycosyltransferase family 2 protein [Streptococcus suis]